MSQRKLHTLIEYAKKKEYKNIRNILEKDDFHKIAGIINLPLPYRDRIFSALSYTTQAKTIIFTTYKTKQALIPHLTDKALLHIITYLDEDDATDLLQHLPAKRRTLLLEKLHEDKRKVIQKLIKYHPETAGGVMDVNFIVVKYDYTVQDVADKIKKFLQHKNTLPTIVVTDDEGKVKGFVPYHYLITASSTDTIQKLIKKLLLLAPTTSKKTLIRHILQKRLDIIAVVDEKKHILGIIRASDASRIIQEQETKSLYRFAGVSQEEDMLDPFYKSVKGRYVWLIINLITAFLAALSVSFFQNTIARISLLAVLMPIVAGMGGNAGTQSLAVVTRGIALGELAWTTNRNIIIKEILAGFFNGLITAVITMPIVFVFTHSLILSLILGMSLIANMIIAGLFGAIIPLSLKMLHIDPAIASSVFVTTATDVFGFLVFLGLASYILL